jgi:cellulose synthase/poly-beta-1,6-N-acetylglucosamine synthase-like glycosyltransferase
VLRTAAIVISLIGVLISIWYGIIYTASMLWSAISRRKRTKRFDRRFAVLIATYNDDVEPSVTHVLSADYSMDKIDVYIIDSSSDEAILQKNRSWTKYPNVKWFWKDRKGFKAGALNFALNIIDMDSYDYIVVLDADGMVDRDFFARMAGDFEETGADIIQTVWKNYTKKHTLLSYYAWLYAGLFHRLVVPVLNFFSAALVFGNGFGVKAEIFRKGVRFDERYVAEDFKLALDVISNGGKILFVDDYGVTTTQPRDLRNMEKQLTRWAYGSTQILFEQIFGKMRINVATSIIILTWVSAYVITPASLITITTAAIVHGWIIADMSLVLALYAIGTLPTVMVGAYYLFRDEVDLPVYKRYLALFMGMPFWFVFSAIGAAKYILGKGPSWSPTAKVIVNG